MRQSAWDRVWSRIDVGLCWEWDRGFSHGYGQTSVDGQYWLTHRLIWTWLVGPIPEGMTLDHLCRNLRCCNPDHLEVVTHAENKRRGYSRNAINARKDKCDEGHPLEGDNLMLKANGERACRICNRASQRRRYRARKVQLSDDS